MCIADLVYVTDMIFFLTKLTLYTKQTFLSRAYFKRQISCFRKNVNRKLESWLSCKLVLMVVKNYCHLSQKKAYLDQYLQCPQYWLRRGDKGLARSYRPGETMSFSSSLVSGCFILILNCQIEVHGPHSFVVRSNCDPVV